MVTLYLDVETHLHELYSLMVMLHLASVMNGSKYEDDNGVYVEVAY